MAGIISARALCAGVLGGTLALVNSVQVALAQTPQLGIEEPVQPEPQWDVSPQAVKPFFAKRITGYLATRDDVELRYSALLPKGPGPFPVIVNYSGYDPGSIGGSEYLRGNSAMHPPLDKALVERGYAVVGVSARGTACSEGEFEFLGPTYGTDGYDAIEFIASQPWSDGRIGMANWSWAGMSQIATASERPPHLKAIAPGMVLGDPRLDSFAPGGVPQTAFITGWWWFLHSTWDAAVASAKSEGDERCIAQAAKNYVTAEKKSLPVELIRNPLRTETIQVKNLSRRTANINVPILSMEAAQDEATGVRGGYFQETVKPELLWLLHSNGGHDIYAAKRFRDEFLIPFFDRFVKGEQNGFDQKPHVHVWMETTAEGDGIARDMKAAPRWVETSPAFPLEAKPEYFALSEGGTLVRGTGSGKPDAYAYPRPAVEINANGTSSWGALNPGWNEGTRAYTSDALSETILTYGPASADLWVSTTAADSDLQLTLTEVRSDGQEIYVQRGWLRLSDRVQDSGRSTVLRPFPIDEVRALQAMTPGTPALGRVELPKFSHAFRAGSRIRIWIDTPSTTGGFGFAPLSSAAVNKIFHDADHPSRLVLGLIGAGNVPAVYPKCGAVHSQPCRPDPLRTR